MNLRIKDWPYRSALSLAALLFALSAVAETPFNRAPITLPTPPAGADLIVTSLGVSPAGNITYKVANRGQSTTQQPFVVDIYINNVRRDTIKHDPLAAQSVQQVASTLARFDGCQAANLRVVADAQNTVREADEGNNEHSEPVTPPCGETHKTHGRH